MIGRAGRAVRGSVQNLGDQPPHVPAADGVKGATAVTAHGDQTRQPELAQMLRHRRPGRPHRLPERRHVVLAGAEQCHQPQSGPVGQHPQQVGRRHDLTVRRELLLQVIGTCNIVACVHEHILSEWEAAGVASNRTQQGEPVRDNSHSHDHEQPGSHIRDNGHGHGHSHEDDHGGVRSWWDRLRHLAVPHSHDSRAKVDPALESSRDGLRALWISLVGLGFTAAAQAVIVVLSGSVALLGDTLHNVADALTAVPLAIAFLLGRRAATRAYTYGYGRAEDLAGIIIVAVIAASAVAAGWTAITRLLHPAEVTHLPWVAAAGVVGFAGNELVARYRVRVGRRIGSAALVADGLHARTDGYTSLAVVAAAGGAALGWRWADPVVGLVIAVAITFVLKDAAREVYRRLMDAIDPAIVDQAENTLRAVHGVHDVTAVRLRWIGHRLHAEADLVVDADLSLVAAHEIAADAEHQLTHAVPRLTSATVHTDPASHPGAHHHPDLSHQRRQAPPAG